VIWALRGLLGVAIVVLLVGGTPVVMRLVAAEPATPTPEVAATVQPATPIPPTPVPTRRPLPTAEPDKIVSRVLRVVPTPQSREALPEVGGGHQVEVRDFDYFPPTLRIHVGEWVTWTNYGAEEHDLNGSAGSDQWTSGPIFSTQSYTRAFGFAGRFEYVCTYHPTMRGVVQVDP
jgi:plastocyanin